MERYNLVVKYEVRRRRWPFWPPLRRPWELLRDGRPISFYHTELEALDAKETLETMVTPNRAERRRR